MKYIFLDTNYFLHFQAFDDVDWKKVVKADNLTIVIVSTVISELDKKKTDTNQKIRKRAKTNLNKIEQYYNQDSLKNGYGFKIITNEPSLETFANNRLAIAVADDCIIASVIEFRETEKADVYLISADTGIWIKAKTKGIEALKVPERLALSDEDDPIEKENKKLAAELQKHRNRSPKLRLLFADKKDRIHARVAAFAPKWDLDIRIEEIRRQYPHIVSDNGDEYSSDFYSHFSRISEERIIKYNAALDEFYRQYGE